MKMINKDLLITAICGLKPFGDPSYCRGFADGKNACLQLTEGVGISDEIKELRAALDYLEGKGGKWSDMLEVVFNAAKVELKRQESGK